MKQALPEQPLMSIEALLERAHRTRLIQFTRMNGETITFQIGRVVYAMDRERAIRFLEEALGPDRDESRLVASH